MKVKQICFLELMISILSTMSDFERKMIRERQLEGIKIRKERIIQRETDRNHNLTNEVPD